MKKKPRIFNGEKTISSENGVGKTGQHLQRMKLDCYVISYTKINSKWNKDQNIKPETMKPLKENVGGKFLDISLGDNFFNDTKGKRNKSKHKQVGLHSNKKLTHGKGNHQQNAKATSQWGQIFANSIFDKGLISKIYERLMQLNSKQTIRWENMQRM